MFHFTIQVQTFWGYCLSFLYNYPMVKINQGSAFWKLSDMLAKDTPHKDMTRF